MRRLGLLAILAASTTLAACGSSGPTKRDVIARANAICESASRAALAVTPSFTRGRPSIGYYLQVAPIVQAEAGKLLALPRPAKDQALLTRLMAAVARAAAENRALLAAARRGDDAQVARLNAALRSNPFAELAARYGLSGCARPSVRSVVS